jgi:hypothetical protein
MSAKQKVRRAARKVDREGHKLKNELKTGAKTAAAELHRGERRLKSKAKGLKRKL